MTSPPVTTQHIGQHTVQVVRDRGTGDRFLVVDGDRSHPLPLEIARLCVGDSAWITQTLVKCDECGARQPISEMGDARVCQPCYDAFDPDAQASEASQGGDA